MADESKEEGGEAEEPKGTRRQNPRHSQTYTNDPDRMRDDPKPWSPHQP